MSNHQDTYGPTEQDARDRLNEGKASWSEKHAALKDAQAHANEETESTHAELVAQLDNLPETHTAEGKDRVENAAIAKKYAWANLAPGILGLRIFAALLALAAGGPIMLGIEYSMFFEVFKSWFENGFGELNEGGQFRANLYSLQAVVVVLAVKLWAVSAKRIQLLTGVAFVAAIAFVIGAVLKHANTQFLREAAHSGGGISWDTLPTDLTAATALFGAELTAPLLALGFLIVPIVSAVLIGWSWAQIKDALEGLAKARMFRRSYAADKKAQRARTKAGRELADHEAQQDIIVTAPLNELVNEYLDNARHKTRHIDELRKRGGTTADLAEADAAARKTLDKLGNGFVKDAFAKWQADQRGSPP